MIFLVFSRRSETLKRTVSKLVVRRSGNKSFNWPPWPPMTHGCRPVTPASSSWTAVCACVWLRDAEREREREREMERGREGPGASHIKQLSSPLNQSWFVLRVFRVSPSDNLDPPLPHYQRYRPTLTLQALNCETVTPSTRNLVTRYASGPAQEP